jgi:hypothetical protein
MAAVVALAGALEAAKDGVSPLIVLALLFAALAFGLTALRRGTGPLVGPLFFYDLVRLARKGRGTALRIAYGAVLLVGLGLVYQDSFPQHDLFRLDPGPGVSLADQARFAERFVVALLVIQNAAVLVLTPAYLGAAVAEEREHRTLDLLFTTPLRNREILLGKFFGRLLHLGAVLLVGLPVLSLAQLWGGVDVAILAAGFASTAFTLLSVGSLSLLCSVHARTGLGAAVAAYALAAFPTLGCLCFGGASSRPSPSRWPCTTGPTRDLKSVKRW